MQTADDQLMAIDVSLEPDQTMIDKANAPHGTAAGNYLPMAIARRVERAALIGDSPIGGIWPLTAKPNP